MTQEQIIEAVEKMTVLELNQLVKAIEEKWGVSAAAVAVAGPAAGPAAEEKSEFNVELTSFGEQKKKKGGGGMFGLKYLGGGAEKARGGGVAQFASRQICVTSHAQVILVSFQTKSPARSLAFAFPRRQTISLTRSNSPAPAHTSCSL